MGFSVIILLGSACSGFPIQLPTLPAVTTPSSTTAQPPTSLPEVEVSFRVKIPPNTPAGQPVYLNVLEEVTGLALSAQPIAMQLDGDGSYSLRKSFPMGSVVKYRYSRLSPSAPVLEHVSDGRQVRYRIYHVEGPGQVEDIVSRWTDTAFNSPTGRISGQIRDAASGQPVPNLLVLVGGAQTLTTSDGTFLVEGLPPGTHNLIAYALDGSYRTFQQGALVASDSTTPANFSIQPAHNISLIFVVSVPQDTIPAVPIRLAGNLIQLGNTFADLSGGVSTLASRMPTLSLLPDGRYSLTMHLPAGADIHYLYTMGDGFWNSEKTAGGGTRIRQIVVPENNAVIEDRVESWYSGSSAPITFDMTVPGNTPPEDYVSIQLNPVFGWTEPIPMWRLGNNHWAFVLTNPLDIVAHFNYRFCRNDQCGSADDAATRGERSVGYPMNTSLFPQTIVDQVDSWAWIENNPPQIIPSMPAVNPRGNAFLAGVEILPAYRPSWNSNFPRAIADLQGLGGNWIIVTPSWTFTRVNPPVLEQVPGQDPLWQDLISMIGVSQQSGLNVALDPTPHISLGAAAMWREAERSFSWWLVWFDRYRSFALHHADLAAHSGAQALILGGDWMEPALPGGALEDGTPSGVPADAESRWRNLLQEVRSRYNGPIMWSLSFQRAAERPPAFLDSVDQVYILFSEPLASNNNPSLAEMETEAARLLDSGLAPLFSRFNKPIILAAGYPSADGASTSCLPDPQGGCLDQTALSRPNDDIPTIQLDLQEQADIYQALLSTINNRTWIYGFVTRGYYPPAILQDKSTSIHGKPAQSILQAWFPHLLGVIPP